METHARTTTRPSITAVILAGGRGRRMGGADKGLLALRGKPLIAHLLDTLRPQVDHILINCNRHGDAYRRFGYPLLPDRLPDCPGPLAGVLAALEAAPDELVLSVPCDTPALPADLAARLYAALITDGRPLATVHDGERLHPVILLARKGVADDLRRYLEAGERRVEAWVRAQVPAMVDYSGAAAAFANANTPAELARLEGASHAP